MKRRMHYPYNSSKQRSTIHNRCHIFGYELACKSKQQQIIGIDKHLRSHICWNRYADTEHQLVSSVSQEIWAWFEIIFVKLHIWRSRITHETTRANHNVIIRSTFHFAFPKLQCMYRTVNPGNICIILTTYQTRCLMNTTTSFPRLLYTDRATHTSFDANARTQCILFALSHVVQHHMVCLKSNWTFNTF